MANSQLPSGSDATISVPVAKTEVTSWKTYLQTSDLIAESFLFPMTSIHSLIAGTPEADGIRIYLALQTPGDPTSLTTLLVPTLDGKDIVRNVSAPGNPPGGDDDDTNIYNYAQKCPPACPPVGHTLMDAQ